MASVVWPASLNSTLLLGLGEGFEDTVVRTPTDSGPAKVRSRYTAGVRPLSIPVALTTTQASTLDTFFHISLVNGALRFDWQHPRTGATHEMRFLEPPQLVQNEPGLYRGTLRIEVLP